MNARAPLHSDDLALITDSYLFQRTDQAYFHTLIAGVMRDWVSLDEMLSPYLDRGMEKVDAVERAVLRIAALELQQSEVPYRSVINEAIEVARLYGADHGFRFVNGVLDQLAASRYAKVKDARPAPAPSRVHPKQIDTNRVKVSYVQRTTPDAPHSPAAPPDQPSAAIKKVTGKAHTKKAAHKKSSPPRSANVKTKPSPAKPTKAGHHKRAAHSAKTTTAQARHAKRKSTKPIA